MYAFTFSHITKAVNNYRSYSITTSVYRRRRRIFLGWRDAPVRIAVHRRPVQERDAFLPGPLVRASGDAVLPVIDARHLKAPVRLAAEEVVRVGEVLKVRQFADARGYLAGEHVVRDVELLQRAHVANGVRQRAGDAVEAEVEHGELVQLADLRRDAGGDAAVEENQLVERPGHVADAARQAAPQPRQVRQHDHGRR
jgi:hypothetical protein